MKKINKKRTNKENYEKKYDENLSSKCKVCKRKLYIKIFRNKSNKRQMGLYCSKCNKYHKFINDDDVFYYVGVGCKIVNTYGSLYYTKLYKLKDITNIYNTIK